MPVRRLVVLVPVLAALLSATGASPGTAHEFGHGIGFAHVSEDKDASAGAAAQIMYFQSVSSGTDNRYLWAGDYEAVCTVYDYPANAADGC